MSTMQTPDLGKIVGYLIAMSGVVLALALFLLVAYVGWLLL